jgi:hypothetical protein
MSNFVYFPKKEARPQLIINAYTAVSKQAFPVCEAGLLTAGQE